jgi:protein-S-isoprenylcysteine O-methyltransferase Ste14
MAPLWRGFSFVVPSKPVNLAGVESQPRMLNLEEPTMGDSPSTTTVVDSVARRLRLLNFAASAAVVASALAFYSIAPQNRRVAARHFELLGLHFSGAEFLVAAAAAYVVALGVFFLTETTPGTSKSLRFWQIAGYLLRSPTSFRWTAFNRSDRVAVLATLLKGLFGPLMTMALMTATMGLIDNGLAVYDRHLHWFLFQCIVMADVFVFTFGYLVELPRLKNQIRSVDPTFIGWAAALVCYTPFNIVLGALLGSPGGEFPQFASPWLHYGLNAALLSLMAIYTWASIALGLKASNLTHRGIVVHGPYRWVRHPAYVCKNMAWWIGSIPIVQAAFGVSTYAGLMALGSVVGWALLYVLRAMTEEDHLRSVDSEYAAYAAQVRYRFIPGLL